MLVAVLCRVKAKCEPRRLRTQARVAAHDVLATTGFPASSVRWAGPASVTWVGAHCQRSLEAWA